MKYVVFAFCLATFVSCDSSKLSETPEKDFVGVWKLTDRGMFEGIEIEIAKDERGNLVGTIAKLNEDKYVNMFMEEGDKFVTGISRNSNFEFTISEKKIAAPLFSAYGQSTTSQFTASFKGKNKILLGKDGADGAYVKL